MKVSFKLDLKVETVNNISVDDKCFPLIGGVHPFSTSSTQKKLESPLIRESALWFTTLAVDTIYVDCDRCLIFWTAVQNDVGQEVMLRKQISQARQLSSHDFIPPDAKPLFEDFTLFDFDASLKEMMGKCREIAEKLNKKGQLTANVNSRIANLLHVYILPSIKFTPDDIYALSRARCLIEERVMKADSEISLKASGKHLLEVSLDNLKDNLINSYDFESETYIRSCDPTFLKLFMKKIEEDSAVLNLNLAAEQSKVNWAKDHPNEYCLEDIKDLQKKRNEVHAEVEKLIKVREGLRNVLTRKEKVKKKAKKTRPKQIESCFQSIFVEINRRWEVDMKAMDQLILDKVHISGAREATLSAILELQAAGNGRNSDRSTQFMPVDFSDCHYNGAEKEEKTSNWMTVQERVTHILHDTKSSSYKVFMDGCTFIVSKIDLALSEYRLVNIPPQTVNSVQNDASVSLRQYHVSPLSQDIRDRRSGMVIKDDACGLSKRVMQKNLMDNMKSASHQHQNQDMNVNKPKEDTCVSMHILGDSIDGGKDALPLSPDHFSLSKENRLTACSYNSIPDSDVGDSVTETSFTMSSDARNTARLLAMKNLNEAVAEIKATITEHFLDAINALQTDLDDLGDDAIVVDLYIDRNDLIWKSYERHFSEKVISSLILLYQTSLMSSISGTFEDVRQTSKFDLLEGDKILALFFDSETADSRNSAVLVNRRSDDKKDTYSMAASLSSFSLDIRDCSITDLYTLTNADNDDICKRFNFEESQEGTAQAQSLSSSSDSGTSVKTSDLFGSTDCLADDGPSTSAASNESTVTENSEYSGVVHLTESSNLEDLSISHDFDELKRSSIASRSSGSDVVVLKRSAYSRANSNRTSELLDMVLTPFQKQMERCIRGKSILDKLRYLSKGIEGLNKDISKLYGVDHHSACDDIITMLILALSHMPKDIFIELYINLNLLSDILPKFLNGSLCEYNVVSLVASYDYLKNRNASQQVVRRSSINKL